MVKEYKPGFFTLLHPTLSPSRRLYEPEASTPSLHYNSLPYGVCHELSQIFQSPTVFNYTCNGIEDK
jgi:hypothetical protein